MKSPSVTSKGFLLSFVEKSIIVYNIFVAYVVYLIKLNKWYMTRIYTLLQNIYCGYLYMQNIVCFNIEYLCSVWVSFLTSREFYFLSFCILFFPGNAQGWNINLCSITLYLSLEPTFHSCLSNPGKALGSYVDFDKT
jgi:hypothetical protein